MEPQKSTANTQQYTFRIPLTLKTELEKIAQEEDRSLSKQIVSALRKYVDERAKDKR